MIERERQGPVEVLRLNHGKASALDLELCNAITESLSSSNADAVVLTGTGNIFSAGVDLYRMTSGGEEYVAQYFPALREMLMALWTFPRPLVAAVNGHAIAGGCLMAAACDVRLMSSGKIGVPELHVGVPFPAVALEILSAAIGSKSRRLAFGGFNVDPAAAVELGLIDSVVAAEELLSSAIATATQLASLPRATYAVTKRQLRSESLARIARLTAYDDEVRALWANPDIHAHISAYLERTVKKSR